MARLTALVLLLPCSFLLAWNRTAQVPVLGPDMDGAARDAVIEATISALRENYVFPEFAETMEADVRGRIAKGEYSRISSGAALASKLTTDLRAICKDLHLSVNYEPRGIPEDGDERPAPEMLERMLAEARWNNFGFERVARLSGNVGYLELFGFCERDSAAADLEAAARDE